MNYKIVIYGDPVVKKNGRSIFKNRATGRHFVGKSDRLIQAERAAVLQLASVDIDTITCPVTVAFKIYTRTRRKIDLSNAVQLYEDALERVEILENDSQIRSLDGTRQYLDRLNPRVEIHISDFVDLGEGECIM